MAKSLWAVGPTVFWCPGADAPAQSGICDNFRPRYAVDLQVLAEDGEPDPNLPILAGVPLSVPVGGDEMGFFAVPGEGTMVVVNACPASRSFKPSCLTA